MKHFIKKQVIDLSIDRKLDAFSMQQKAGVLYYDELLPALEQAFDKLAANDQVILIDRLEINLGCIKEAELYQRYFIDQLLASLQSQVFEQIIVPSQDQYLIRREKSTVSIYRQWLFYMRNGYLPWNAETPGPDWYSSVLETGAVDFESIQLLRELIRGDRRALERIILNHDNNFLSHLVELLTACNQADLGSMVREVVVAIEFIMGKKSSTLFQPRQKLIQSIWKEILQVIGAEPVTKNYSPAVMAEIIIRECFTSAQLSRIKKSGSFMKKMVHTRSIWKKLSPRQMPASKTRPDNTVQEFIQRFGSAATDNALVHHFPGQEMGDRIASLKKIVQPHLDVDQLTKPACKDGAEPGKTDADEDEIYLPLAGLVLLNPFLNPLFKALSLVENGQFINESSKEQALLLLHWLATGSQEVPEHQLVLPKILCGWPVHQPVDVSIVLNNAQLHEGEEVLSAAIDQWEILKGTSPAGLREGFLQRNGKISNKEGQVLLQVEASSIDMLLDYLPWNIGFIKLPWMTRLLKVEWR